MIFALFVRTFLVQAFVVPTSSMERTVLAGDHVVVNKFVFGPRAFEALDLAVAGPRREDIAESEARLAEIRATQAAEAERARTSGVTSDETPVAVAADFPTLGLNLRLIGAS